MKIPINSHKHTVHNLSSDCKYLIEKRILKFIHNGLNSNSVCQNLLQVKLTCKDSCFAGNYRFLSHKYNINSSDWTNDIAILYKKLEIKLIERLNTKAFNRGFKTKKNTRPCVVLARLVLVILYYSDEENGEKPDSARIVAGAHNIRQLSGNEDEYYASTYTNHGQYDPVAVSIIESFQKSKRTYINMISGYQATTCTNMRGYQSITR